MYHIDAVKCNKSQFNKFGNYNYRSCEDILESVKPLLKENNLTEKYFVQNCQKPFDDFYCSTVFIIKADCNVLYLFFIFPIVS